MDGYELEERIMEVMQACKSIYVCDVDTTGFKNQLVKLITTCTCWMQLWAKVTNGLKHSGLPCIQYTSAKASVILDQVGLDYLVMVDTDDPEDEDTLCGMDITMNPDMVMSKQQKLQSDTYVNAYKCIDVNTTVVVAIHGHISSVVWTSDIMLASFKEQVLPHLRTAVKNKEKGALIDWYV